LTRIEFADAGGFEYRLQQVHAELGMKAIPFLHRSMVPLHEVDFSTDEDRGQHVYSQTNVKGCVEYESRLSPERESSQVLSVSSKESLAASGMSAPAK